MKLEIIGKAYAEAEVDLVGFKADLPKEWDMEKTINTNTKITLSDKRFSENELKSLIWGAIDWTGVIERLAGEHKPLMKVKFYFVRYEDWKRLYPGLIGKKTFEFTERKETGHATILVQDLEKNKNFDLAAFIRKGGYLYAPTDNTPIIGWL